MTPEQQSLLDFASAAILPMTGDEKQAVFCLLYGYLSVALGRDAFLTMVGSISRATDENDRAKVLN